MLKKMIAVSGAIAILSFAMPVSAQTTTAHCGFFANLFGICKNTATDQSANILNSRGDERISSTTRQTQPIASTTAAAIACVGAAITTRETTLDTAMTTYTQALNNAYATRKTDLATAYTQTTIAGLRAGIKVAWTTFNTSTKTAQRAWQSTRQTAWSTFRTAAKSCRGSDGLTDSANSVTEMSGE